MLLKILIIAVFAVYISSASSTFPPCWLPEPPAGNENNAALVTVHYSDSTCTSMYDVRAQFGGACIYDEFLMSSAKTAFFFDTQTNELYVDELYYRDKSCSEPLIAPDMFGHTYCPDKSLTYNKFPLSELNVCVDGKKYIHTGSSSSNYGIPDINGWATVTNYDSTSDCANGGLLKSSGMMARDISVCVPRIHWGDNDSNEYMMTTCVSGGPGFISYTYADSSCIFNKKATASYEMPASLYPDTCDEYTQRITCGASGTFPPVSTIFPTSKPSSQPTLSPTESTSSNKKGTEPKSSFPTTPLVGGLLGGIFLMAIMYYFYSRQQTKALAAADTTSAPRVNQL